MKNRINLSNYNIRTDLVIENINDKNINKNIRKTKDNISITTINVDKSLSIDLKRKKGTYITIEFQDITNFEDRIKVSNELEEELKKLIKKIGIEKNDSCLIIGLGNIASTADSLGPKTISKIIITRHLFELNTNIKDGIREVSALSPGVMAQTGIETSDQIESIVKKIKPKFLIVIDALASSSIDRINKTIQLTDTGINPGSGVGNNRKEISYDTIGIPVIAIGVPTVVESKIIVNDTINYLFKHISYIKNNYNKNKLIINHSNYLEKIKDSDLTKKEKQEVSGILGELDYQKREQLISEVLNNLNYNLIVTPKEIDFLIDKLATLISTSINKSLHKEINEIIPL